MQCARERVELNVLDFEQLEVRVRQRVRPKLMVELHHTADSILSYEAQYARAPERNTTSSGARHAFTAEHFSRRLRSPTDAPL